jgi:iron-sulfur cluster assembly accessory protein
MINLTETAANAIRNAMEGAKEPVEGLRILVQAGGCAGHKYLMGLVQTATEGDILVEQRGVKLFVDSGSVSLLQGVTLDFTVGLEGAGFTFENPNASSSCSCGKSFS